MVITISIILGFLVGYLAQKTGLCLVRGVQELIEKKPAFIFTICSCGLWLYVFRDVFELQNSHRYSITFPFLIGGFFLV